MSVDQMAQLLGGSENIVDEETEIIQKLEDGEGCPEMLSSVLDEDIALRNSQWLWLSA